MDMPVNAQHANPPVVTLSVQRSDSTEPGWTRVDACGKTYSYRYDGGSDDHGNIVVHGRGMATITVRLVSDHDLNISAVAFDNDPDHQLSRSGNSPRVATILDQNDKTMENGYYAIEVTDGTNNCQVTFDPRISNT